jgi:hypothetical protein
MIAGKARIFGSDDLYFIRSTGEREKVLHTSKFAWLCDGCETVLIQG